MDESQTCYPSTAFYIIATGIYTILLVKNLAWYMEFLEYSIYLH